MSGPRRSPSPRGVGRLAAALVLVTLLASGGCGSGSSTSSGSTATTPAGFDFGANNPLLADAFGDSITEGNGGNYPSILQSMLQGLDPNWRVNNRGLGGERVEEGAARLPGVLGADHPGFVLLMEGTNNAAVADDPAFIVANLQQMVQTARGNQTIPVLGTIPPNFRSFSDPAIVQGVIDEANAMIRSMARAERVVLAEIHDGMNDPSLFGDAEGDPLHPNAQGYAVMAGIWFDALQRALPGGPPKARRASGQRATAR
ncbi:MAG: SGNH/GDSL hydrolase family protein [Candidatus Rokubacteria bacterium]|nr:SGNH/GDSL hydrolase family protein [Candidatus Rokubacteria bacterium]